MELRLLPLDLMRCISEWLTTSDMARLHATFDRSIQRLTLASSPVCKPFSTQGHLKYWLSSLKNVKELDMTGLRQNNKQAPIDTQLFRNLNPQRLIVDKYHLWYYSTSPELLVEDKGDPFDDSFFYDCAPQTPVSTPTLADYAPALQHIRVINGISFQLPSNNLGAEYKDFAENWRAGLGFPPTLLSLEIVYLQQIDLNTFMPLLPRSLTSLFVQNSNSRKVVLADVFSWMPSLTSLKLDLYGATYDPSGLEPPASLTELYIGDTTTFPLALLRSPSFRAIHSLTKLSLIAFPQLSESSFSAKDAEVDLASLLPSGLTLLTHSTPSHGRIDGHQVKFASFPPNLTRLKLLAHTSTNIALGPALLSLRHLTSLTIRSNTLVSELCWMARRDTMPSANTYDIKKEMREKLIYFDLSMLPTGLKYFKMTGHGMVPMAEEHVAVLPKSLTLVRSLTVDLVMANAFHKLLPGCELRCSKPFAPFETPEQLPLLLANFARLTEPVFDSEALYTAFNSFYAPKKILLNLTIRKKSNVFGMAGEETFPAPFVNTTQVILSPTSGAFNDIPEMKFIICAFPNLTSLRLSCLLRYSYIYTIDVLPPNLTRLELNRINLTLSCNLPQALTYLSSDLSCHTPKIELSKLPNLTFLDAPLWQFCSPDPAVPRDNLRIVAAKLLPFVPQ